MSAAALNYHPDNFREDPSSLFHDGRHYQFYKECVAQIQAALDRGAAPEAAGPGPGPASWREPREPPAELRSKLHSAARAAWDTAAAPEAGPEPQDPYADMRAKLRGAAPPPTQAGRATADEKATSEKLSATYDFEMRRIHGARYDQDQNRQSAFLGLRAGGRDQRIAAVAERIMGDGSRAKNLTVNDIFDQIADTGAPRAPTFRPVTLGGAQPGQSLFFLSGGGGSEAVDLGSGHAGAAVPTRIDELLADSLRATRSLQGPADPRYTRALSAGAIKSHMDTRAAQTPEAAADAPRGAEQSKALLDNMRAEWESANARDKDALNRMRAAHDEQMYRTAGSQYFRDEQTWSQRR